MNMKKTYKLFVPGCLMLVLLFGSCNDWLEVEPEDGVIKENYWTTKEEVYASLIGCYSAMIQDGMPEKMFLWGELRGETVMPTTSVPSSYQNIIDGDIISSNSITSWSLFYKVINQCNTLIKYAPEAQASDESFTDAMLAQYQAEAVAIRSLMYFYLVRTFRDVPFIIEAVVSDDQDLQIKKTDGSVVLDSVIYDLEAAALNMSSRFGEDPAVNKGRFTTYGVYSLLADIYLWQEDYAGCIRNCDKVINSGQVSLLYADGSNLIETETNNALTGLLDTVYYLVEGEANNFYNLMYFEGNCDESIFELQRESDFPNDDFYYLFSFAYLAPRTDVIKEMFFIPSEVDNSWYDMRTEGVSYKGSYIWKYIGTAREGAATSYMRTLATMTCNTIIYRLADVMLMKAEALVQQAKPLESDSAALASGEVETLLSEAWDIVKQIRLRSNATEMTDLCNGITDASNLTVTTMEQFVYEERVRECMFEGKRWFDALRHAKRDDYAGNNIHYLNDIALYSASAAKVANLQTKLKNKDFHYLPINQSEIEANKALVQNPFYE